MSHVDATDFPTPPIEPSETILHISNSAMLREEEGQQGIDLAHELPNLRSGCSCAYRVVSPERATLALYTRDYRWYITLLAGPAGAPVRRDTFDAVLDWLCRGQPPRHRPFVTRYALQLASFRGE